MWKALGLTQTTAEDSFRTPTIKGLSSVEDGEPSRQPCISISDNAKLLLNSTTPGQAVNDVIRRQNQCEEIAGGIAGAMGAFRRRRESLE
ncbi:hypothetical protein MPTK1_2g24370 [Marchantia polymorpha subsp. ruderalis]|uniref:Uncharacterized protein n=1 Tax=Marchantia polymorpha TaxID=3197 RepID=A0A2R6WPI6_MARPO|nr:hypothetical protein MARPO_0069s0086 [Marchantia polymorpha]BBN03548.1 hypothetical protein Mp_2g24370 [Marchantia polymorpha subsp. ruderalis]|eukprot:PTQ35754.1 hypothetical protein MARPO_0069s0086 [Marchantia polymorpha]